MGGSVTFATEVGGRPYQQDRYVGIPFAGNGFNAWLLGVFDGHGDTAAVSECCKKNLQSRVWPSELADPERFLRSVVAELVVATRYYSDGSTLSLALVVEREGSPKTVTVAILGDSPVIVFDRAGKVRESPEHNIRSNPDECQAVTDRGGNVRDGYVHIRFNFEYGLQLSRALGDSYFNEILSCEPDVYTISDPTWILVASDGIFDSDHAGDIPLVEIESFAKQGADADAILEWADSYGLRDNATAIVWKS
ncbi:MAG: PP2C family protein-serine/threonine phosphatase [Candidatus Moraniibacteriota bacterium]